METTILKNYVTIEDEMRRSYLDYAMSVIVGRALPDVRDGLKPVHRRVLWAMHELGNVHNKPHKKSARVVGECFVAGTLVHTEHGLKPIETIEVGENVLMPNGYTSAVVEAYHNPPGALVEITFANGQTMKVTPGQKFRVLQEDLSVAWERADQLEGKLVLASSPRVLGCPPEHPSSERTKAAYVAGLVVAEGFLTDRGRSRRVGIGMVDKEPLEFVAAYCRETGVKASLSERKPQKAHYQPIFTLRFSGLAEATAVCADKCKTKRAPDWVLADRRLFLPFLAGFVDGDGSLRVAESKREIVLATTSPQLTEQLQAMLADCGLHAYRMEQDRQRVQGGLRLYTLNLVGENASRLAGLLMPHLQVAHKREAALQLDNWQRRVLNNTTECIPSSAIFDELSRHHLGAGWYQDKEGRKFRAGIKYPTGAKIRYSSDLKEKTLSYRQIETWGILQKLERVGSPLAEKLRRLMDNYCVLETASVINRGEQAETYDIQIADESHELLVSGIAVSNCLGKYHPHGDTAVYDTIVRMAQNFSLRYPLVDGQGNFGSVDGDNAAAARYTEVRMSRITNEMLSDIEKETVDFQPNYDESLSEPKVLPVRFPQLLVNGSEGIAVGMATKMPPHNLTEIVNATIALVRDPGTTIEELMKFVSGPDFPTGGFIYGKSEIRKAYTEGRGILQLRAKAGVDRLEQGTMMRDAIVVTEIPFQVNKSRLLERIGELINEKKIDGIHDLRDESDRDGMRIVVELKRDAIPQVVLNNLYKLTPMQTSFGIINLAIVNGQPRVLTLKQMLEAFVDFRREVVRRRTQYELRRAQARAHILEGLTKAIDALDYIVTTIRNARSVDEARQWLTGNTASMSETKNWRGVPTNKPLDAYLKDLRGALDRLQFSELQAQAILDLQLRRLSALERQKITDELENLLKFIGELEAILRSDHLVREVIIGELESVRKDYGDKRRTEIIDETAEMSIEDLIPDEEVAITVTNSGYIKRTPITTYQRQGRGGKGRRGAMAKGADFVQHLFIASTHAYLMVFTDDGQVFKLKVHELPDSAAASRGKALVNLISIPTTRKLAGVVPVRDFSDTRYLVMVTRQGVIKKTALSEFQNIRANGINAVNVDEGDELLEVIFTDGEKQIFIATHDGQAVRFNEKQVRPMGRAARGVRGVDLREGDYVVAVGAVSPEGGELMLSISEKGYGKQTKVGDYRLTARGGKGVINMKTTEKTGKVVGVFPVDDDSEIIIITQQGKLIRLTTDKIRETGRSAQGVRLIRTGDEDIVTSASLIQIADGDDDEE